MATMNITAMATHRSSRPRKDESSQIAIDVALHVFRQPAVFRVPAPGHLPKLLKDVIRAAAGDEQVLADISKRCGAPNDYVKEAAQFYLRKLLTSSDGNPYRRLALDPNASAADIRDHKRLLLMWLHPDRNPNLWEIKLFKLVRDAAETLGQVEQHTLISSENLVQKPVRRGHSNATWRHASKKRRQVSVAAILKSAFKKLGLLSAVLMIAIFGIGRLVSDHGTHVSLAKLLNW